MAKKKLKGEMNVVKQKNASIRGGGGHRLTGEKCTSLQMQVKKVVKGVTSESISLEEKVKAFLFCISV